MAALLAWGTLVPSAAAAGAETGRSAGGPVICIDPGHQERGNNELEPVGPGSNEKKPKVSSGTRGVASGKPEHVLTLEVSNRIKEILTAKGFTVVMTREAHNVDISNKERAEAANAAGADLFVRIHADGDTSAKTQGASVLYPAESVSATPEQYALSKAAAGIVLADLVSATGARSRGSVARSDLSGFNWSTVPNVLVEMGFMTNPEEDRLLQTDEYQIKMAEGIAGGIERYMTEVAGKPAWHPEPYAEKLTLLESADLYDRQTGRLVPVGAYLGPQTVNAREKAGHWYLIDTWLGANWIYAPNALAGGAQETEERIELTSAAKLYRYPSGSEAAVSELAPQTVQANGRWGEWIRVQTWLGDMWLHQP